MTPLEIDILLHYHTRGIDYPDLSPPAQQSTIVGFLTDGYLEHGDNMPEDNMKYHPTDKLHFYVDAICSVPEPVQIWVIPPHIPESIK